LQKVNPLLDFGCLLSGGDNFLNASDKKKGVAKIKQHKETVAANWIDLSKARQKNKNMEKINNKNRLSYEYPSCHVERSETS